MRMKKKNKIPVLNKENIEWQRDSYSIDDFMHSASAALSINESDLLDCILKELDREKILNYSQYNNNFYILTTSDRIINISTII